MLMSVILTSTLQKATFVYQESARAKLSLLESRNTKCHCNSLGPLSYSIYSIWIADKLWVIYSVLPTTFYFADFQQLCWTLLCCSALVDVWIANL